MPSSLKRSFVALSILAVSGCSSSASTGPAPVGTTVGTLRCTTTAECLRPLAQRLGTELLAPPAVAHAAVAHAHASPVTDAKGGVDYVIRTGTGAAVIFLAGPVQFAQAGSTSPIRVRGRRGLLTRTPDALVFRWRERGAHWSVHFLTGYGERAALRFLSNLQPVG